MMIMTSISNINIDLDIKESMYILHTWTTFHIIKILGLL